MADEVAENPTERSGEAVRAVKNARALLSDFEDVSVEVQHGSLKHAIDELRNAKRRLPDEY